MARLTLIGVFVLLSAQSYAERTYYCEIATTNTIDGRTKSESAKVWMKGPTKFRLENTRGTVKTIYIGNESDVWQVAPQQKTAYHLKQSPAALTKMKQNDRAIGVELGPFLKMGGKKIRQETVG